MRVGGSVSLPPISHVAEAAFVVTCLPLIAGGGPGIIRSSGALLLPRASSHPLAGNGTPPETPLPVDQSGIPGVAARIERRSGAAALTGAWTPPRGCGALLGRLSGERACHPTRIRRVVWVRQAKDGLQIYEAHTGGTNGTNRFGAVV